MYSWPTWLYKIWAAFVIINIFPLIVFGRMFEWFMKRIGKEWKY